MTIVIKCHHVVLGEPSLNGDVEQPDATFRVDLLRYSISQLLKASGVKDSKSLALIDLVVGAGTLDAEATGDFAADMLRLVDEAIRSTGKVKVRYVGDLKESTYGLDARFFHLGPNATDEELKEIVFGKLKTGQKKATLINLSNVRDIEVTTGSADVVELEKEIKTVQNAATVIKGWQESDFGLCAGMV